MTLMGPVLCLASSVKFLPYARKTISLPNKDFRSALPPLFADLFAPPPGFSPLTLYHFIKKYMISHLSWRHLAAATSYSSWKFHKICRSKKLQTRHRPCIYDLQHFLELRSQKALSTATLNRFKSFGVLRTDVNKTAGKLSRPGQRMQCARWRKWGSKGG